MSYDSNEGIPIIGLPRQRRNSFLDAGGPNSINEFASSFSRMQLHMQNIIIPSPEESPEISPRFSFGAGVGEDGNLHGSFGQSNFGYGALLNDELNGHSNNFNHNSNPSIADYNSVFNESFLGGANNDPEEQSLVTRSRSRLFSINSRITGKTPEGALIIGRSTAPQTIFNSINILIGVGLYSLSFGFRYSGLVYGVVMLVLCGIITDYSAVLIGRCLKANASLFSYGDIAQHCYGGVAFVLVVISFSMDLIGAAVALIILFSDSFHTFFPSVSKLAFRLGYCAIILGLSLLPLSVLSNLSFVGIVCTSSTVIVCIIAGLLKPSGFGSLWSISDIHIWPTEYKLLLVSLGIFLALFGGHAVFPELYRDMRHPVKFGKSITIAFSFTVALDLTAALVGYLMFGNSVDEILTNSIMTTAGYPSWVSTVLCLFLGLVPLTKGPLVIRPVATVLDQYFGVAAATSSYHPVKVFDKAVIIFMAFLIANLCSSFATVMAVMGSLICFTICITLPLMFYYKMFYGKLGEWEKLAFQSGIAVSVVLTIAGTYGAIMY